MRLGFNWAKGPFEMLEEIGVKNFYNKIDEFNGNNFLENLSKTKNENLVCLTEDNYFDFKKKIQIALSEKEKFKDKRINYAFSNSWDKKFLEMKKITCLLDLIF